jgi:hypothetical protein
MDIHKFSGLSASNSTRELSSSLTELYKSMGVSSSILRTIQMPNIGLLSDLGKMVAGTGIDQLLGQLSGLASAYHMNRFDIRELGFSGFSGLETMVRSLNLSPELMGLGSGPGLNLSKSIFADLSVIASFTRSMGITPDLATMFQSTGYMNQAPAIEGLSEMTRAISNLPTWLKPASLQQAFQPSWEIAASLGIAGIGRPGLIQDALRAIYTERVQTAGFEAAIEMLQIADDADGDVADRVLLVLRTYVAGIVDLLAQSKDWVAQQGLIQILMLILVIATYHENHLSRLDADTQTQLALEQARDARASSSPASSLAKQEIAQHLDQIDRDVSQLLKDRETSQDVRVLIRMAPLRATPDARGTIIRQLYPDDRVRLIEIQNGWARVEVYEYKSETVINGWMSRRVLRLCQQ